MGDGRLTCPNSFGLVEKAPTYMASSLPPVGRHTLPGTLCTTWPGVCTGNYSQPVLALSARGLSGTLPTEIGLLSDTLIRVSLGTNSLSGSIPTELGALRLLGDLNLGNNTISGWLPPQLDHAGADLPKVNLKRRSFVGNRLSGTLPSAWSGTQSHYRLWLTDNALSGTLPPSWGGLSADALLLSGNRLSGTLPPEWARLQQLTDLWLDRNALSGTLPSQLGRMAHLRALGLEEVSALSGTLPASLGRLPRLEHIVFGGHARARISGTLPTEWGAMANLGRLLAYDCAISGTLPAQLANLSTLSTLCLRNNAVSGTVPAALGTVAMQDLVIMSSQISGHLPHGPAYVALAPGGHADRGLLTERHAAERVRHVLPAGHARRQLQFPERHAAGAVRQSAQAAVAARGAQPAEWESACGVGGATLLAAAARPRRQPPHRPHPHQLGLSLRLARVGAPASATASATASAARAAKPREPLAPVGVRMPQQRPPSLCAMLFARACRL